MRTGGQVDGKRLPCIGAPHGKGTVCGFRKLPAHPPGIGLRVPADEGEEVGGGALEISFGFTLHCLVARDGEGLALEFVLVRLRQEGASFSPAS